MLVRSSSVHSTGSGGSHVSSCRDLSESALQHKHQHGAPLPDGRNLHRPPNGMNPDEIPIGYGGDNNGEVERTDDRRLSTVSALSRTSSCREMCETPLQHRHQHGAPEKDPHSLRPTTDDSANLNSEAVNLDHAADKRGASVLSTGSHVSSCRDICGTPLQHMHSHGAPQPIGYGDDNNDQSDTADDRRVSTVSALSHVSSCREVCESPLQHRHQHGAPERERCPRSLNRITNESTIPRCDDEDLGHAADKRGASNVSTGSHVSSIGYGESPAEDKNRGASNRAPSATSGASHVSTCREICESPLQHRHQHGAPERERCPRSLNRITNESTIPRCDDEDLDHAANKRGASVLSTGSHVSSCRDICGSPLQHLHSHGAPQPIGYGESPAEDKNRGASNRAPSATSGASHVSTCREICETPLQHRHQFSVAPGATRGRNLSKRTPTG